MNSEPEKTDVASLQPETASRADLKGATQDGAPAPSNGGGAGKAAGEDKDQGQLTESDLRKCEEYINDVATGKIPFSLLKGQVSGRYSEYAYNLSGYLSHTLGMTRKEVVTLALCHYARALTSAPIVVQHDLAMLTQGMQLCLTDLTQEVAEMSMLALSVADQEEIAGAVKQ